MSDHPNDAYADRLLRYVALPLVDDARDDLAAAHRVIRRLDRCDLENVAFILAALVPDTVSVGSLAWWRFPPAPVQQPPPCGTPEAYRRHKRAGAQPVTCRPCVDAHRAWDAGRKRVAREAS